MKHHFGDSLDRTADYWTIIPNRERYAYMADVDIPEKENVKILTISKTHENWEQVFQCHHLEELTLHDPSKEQVQALSKLTQLKRLRITFLRTADILFLSSLPHLEELVLEYVSGFSDLTPLVKLPKLRSLHLENLRRVTAFDGLKGLDNLRYLYISGTLDWNQPIENFEFLKGLPGLEVFSLGFITSKAAFPAFLPLLELQNLKKIAFGRATFKTAEYAFLKVALPNIEGCSWELWWDYEGRYDFLGKGAGFIKKDSAKAESRCAEFVSAFEKMKAESEEILRNYHNNRGLLPI